jgi:hypothetical protein
MINIGLNYDKTILVSRDKDSRCIMLWDIEKTELLNILGEVAKE